VLENRTPGIWPHVLSQHGSFLFECSLPQQRCCPRFLPPVLPPLRCAFSATSRSSSSRSSASPSSSSHVLSPCSFLMAEPSLKKKVYIVTNPGSDSEDSNEDLIRHLRGHGFHYRRPRHQPAYNDYQQHRPPHTTTDHPPVNDSNSLHVPPAHPILIESTESPTFDETPTALTMTPSLSHPADPSSTAQTPKASLSPDPPTYYDRSANENTVQQQLVGPRKFQSPKPPSGSRPKPTVDNSRRSRVVCIQPFFLQFSHLIVISVSNNSWSGTLCAIG